MADTAAGGYNPGASMLQTNPDVSLKVFMGGGAGDADGGAGMAYNDTASLLRTVPGVELQKFDGGAMRVPGGEGQGRLLQDVLEIKEAIPKAYDEKNNIIRSLDDLRAAFREPGRYEEFIDWLGKRLLNNDLFKNFVKERVLTIEAKETAPRAKRRTRDQIIADELQKSIAKIAKAQQELARLENAKKQADDLLETIRKTGKTGEDLEQAESAKRRTEALIAEQQKQLNNTIATSTAIPNMADAELEALADVTKKDSKTVGSIKPTVPTSIDVASAMPAPVVPEPPLAGKDTKKDEVTVASSEVASSTPPAPLPSVVEEAKNDDAPPTRPQPESTSIVNIPQGASIIPTTAQGGGRRVARTLKSRSKKRRSTFKRK